MQHKFPATTTSGWDREGITRDAVPIVMLFLRWCDLSSVTFPPHVVGPIIESPAATLSCEAPFGPSEVSLESLLQHELFVRLPARSTTRATERPPAAAVAGEGAAVTIAATCKSLFSVDQVLDAVQVSQARRHGRCLPPLESQPGATGLTVTAICVRLQEYVRVDADTRTKTAGTPGSGAAASGLNFLAFYSQFVDKATELIGGAHTSVSWTTGLPVRCRGVPWRAWAHTLTAVSPGNAATSRCCKGTSSCPTNLQGGDCTTTRCGTPRTAFTAGAKLASPSGIWAIKPAAVHWGRRTRPRGWSARRCVDNHSLCTAGAACGSRLLPPLVL